MIALLWVAAILAADPAAWSDVVLTLGCFAFAALMIWIVGRD